MPDIREVDIDNIARFIGAAVTLRFCSDEEGKAVEDFFRAVYNVPRQECPQTDA